MLGVTTGLIGMVLTTATRHRADHRRRFSAVDLRRSQEVAEDHGAGADGLVHGEHDAGQSVVLLVGGGVTFVDEEVDDRGSSIG
jgi:hypothetical protein